MQDSLDVARPTSERSTLLDEHHKVSDSVLEDLSNVGYWGLLVGKDMAGRAPHLPASLLS
jgi:hypothetical protein